MSDFDAVAVTFDQFRAWPAGVPEAIRAGVWSVAGSPREALVLDVGAGTGRIGRAFVEAGHRYIGIDSSLDMLRQFPRTPHVVQAHGEQLPFPDAAIEVVLLMHVLSSAGNWRGLLQDARRVMRPGGVLIVGQASGPDSGVDARMKGRVAEIVGSMGYATDSGRRRQKAVEWLEAAAARSQRLVAATWEAERSPRQFMERHRTGHRFSALPAEVQDEVLRQLGAWAESAFGSLDAVSRELYGFELLVFGF